MDTRKRAAAEVHNQATIAEGLGISVCTGYTYNGNKR